MRAGELMHCRHLTARGSVGIARGCRGHQQLRGVDHASQTLRHRLRALDELAQRLRQRDQRGGQVAAVHRRDVVRAHRRPRLGVVPVQKVAFVPLQPFERRHRAVEMVDERGGREIAEIVRGERRKQAHADIGRRRAPRELRRHVACFLVVVGRQPAVVGGDERLEIPPRLPRGPAQEARARVSPSGRSRGPTGRLSQ